MNVFIQEVMCQQLNRCFLGRHGDMCSRQGMGEW